MAEQTEPKSGVAFPTTCEGKKLLTVGLRKVPLIGIKVFAFGVYGDCEKLTEVMKTKIGTCPAKATKEMYQAVIDCDAGMLVKMVFVMSGNMKMMKKNFTEGLAGNIKKVNGGQKNEELAKRVLCDASDDIKLPTGAVIEMHKLPGYVLETKVIGEVVSKVESELLCRGLISMYFGEDPADKESKERFGASLCSLF